MHELNEDLQSIYFFSKLNLQVSLLSQNGSYFVNRNSSNSRLKFPSIATMQIPVARHLVLHHATCDRPS